MRAALLDALLGDAIPLPSGPCLFVDVGYGDAPLTTERTHQKLEGLFTDVESVGVEAEETRVRAAQARKGENARFVLGGFDLLALGIQDASFVRCLNVLRGYGLWDVKGALIQMGRSLRVGGVLVEGTSDVEGARAAVHVWKKLDPARLEYHGLVCVTDLSRGFAPLMFRDILPRDLRRHATPGEPVFEWLSAWHECATEVRAELRNEPSSSKLERCARVFSDSALRLATARPDTNTDSHARGAIIWTPQRPSTRPEVLSPDDVI